MRAAGQSVVRGASDYVVPVLLVLWIPILAVGYVFDHNAKVRVYRANIAGCERGNLLRVRINTKFEKYDTAMEETARALKASTTPVGQRLYQVFHAAAVTSPDPVPLTSCAEAYDRPEWFWESAGGDPPRSPAGLVGRVGVTSEGGKG